VVHYAARACCDRGDATRKACSDFGLQLQGGTMKKACSICVMVCFASLSARAQTIDPRTPAVDPSQRPNQPIVTPAALSARLWTASRAELPREFAQAKSLRPPAPTAPLWNLAQTSIPGPRSFDKKLMITGIAIAGGGVALTLSSIDAQADQF